MQCTETTEFACMHFTELAEVSLTGLEFIPITDIWTSQKAAQ